MKMEIDKEWFVKRAAVEGDSEIGAGRRTKTIGLPPEEIAELEALALKALPEWAQNEIRAYRALSAAEPVAYRWRWDEATTWILSHSKPDELKHRIIEPLFPAPIAA